MTHCPADEQALIKACLAAESPDAEQLHQVIEIVLKSGGIAYTLERPNNRRHRPKPACPSCRIPSIARRSTRWSTSPCGEATDKTEDIICQTVEQGHFS